MSARQAHVRTVAICGVGLIGGSIAERLRAKARSVRIVGYDREPVLRLALREKLLDESTTSLVDILTKADLVVLSANPSANEGLLRKLSRVAAGGSPLILDTGSMQSGISDLGKKLRWNSAARFIAGHPMAGREVQGLENRQGKLFVDHPFFFDGSANLTDLDRKRLNWFTQSLGSFPLYVNSETHDRVMTDISQIPQLISTLIGASVSAFDRETIHLAGTGLQSMIRLGGSPYSNWRDVFDENSAYLSQRLGLLINNLQAIERKIAAGEDLKEYFKSARRSYSCLW